MLINSIMLLNVVVAVLLVPPCVCVCVRARACVNLYLNTCIYTQDEFISSVTRDKELEEEAMRAEQDKLKLRHAFSKVVRIVALYSRCTRALTFENVVACCYAVAASASTI
jgi:hypothetical protein